MKKIDFYFDFISPYVWLTWRIIPEFVRKNSVHINPIPVLFAGLLNAHGNKGPAEIPAKRAFVWMDCSRWAKLYGLQMQGPPAHPFNPLPSLRLCLACSDQVQLMKLAPAISQACWEEGKDISDENVLMKIVEDVGLDTALLQKISDVSVKDKLKKNTDEAIARGVFGVPTFAADGEIFWGHDRLHHLELFLKGELSLDENLVQKMITLPRAADRKNF